MSVNDLDYRGSINLINLQIDPETIGKVRLDYFWRDHFWRNAHSNLLWLDKMQLYYSHISYDESRTGSTSERRILNNFSLLFFRDKMLSSLQFYTMWSFAMMRDSQWRSMESNLIIEKFSEEKKTHKPFQNLFSFLIN